TLPLGRMVLVVALRPVGPRRCRPRRPDRPGDGRLPAASIFQFAALVASRAVDRPRCRPALAELHPRPRRPAGPLLVRQLAGAPDLDIAAGLDDRPAAMALAPTRKARDAETSCRRTGPSR